jgi:hypothetical protein
MSYDRDINSSAETMEYNTGSRNDHFLASVVPVEKKQLFQRSF